MAVRKVVTLPESVLKRTADPLDIEVAGPLLEDLIETMKVSPACVGLAAPQIGIPSRAFVVDVSGHPKTSTCHGLIAMFNPVIVERSGNVTAREGCMSVPDLTANVSRSDRIVVQGSGSDGKEIVIATEGFESRAFQHEIDHLDGYLILDRVASLATDVFRRRVYK